jgi:hypothetical protein
MSAVSFKRLLPYLAPHKIAFQDPDTGRKFIAKTKAELIQKIVTYRAQNELPEIEHLNIVLENYWCSLPENNGICEEAKLERGLLAYLNGGISLVKNMLYPKFATQEEAERRAAICVTCPHNVIPGETVEEKKGFLKWSDDLAYHAIGDRKTPYDESLGNCQICTCPLRPKVFWGRKIELPKDHEIQTIPECWQRRENQK